MKLTAIFNNGEVREVMAKNKKGQQFFFAETAKDTKTEKGNAKILMGNIHFANMNNGSIRYC